MSHCSSCGRFTGPYEACPYCGARQSGRITVRSVKATAAILASVGLLALWLAATGSQIPHVQIGQLVATSNMAYVRIQGRVVQGPDYYAESGYLAFTLHDGTGEIRVSAYQNESDDLRLGGRIPSLGDNVSVAGTVRVRDQGPVLTINLPEQLELLRPEPVERAIGSISLEDHLLRVRIRGQVWAVEVPYDGLTVITLRDLTGSIPVPVHRELESLSGALLPLNVGESAEVLGTVDLYRGAAQVVPVSTGDILLTEPVSVAHSRDLGTLASSDVGKMVSIEGRVTDLVHLPSGVRLTLDDSNAEQAVVIWNDVLGQTVDPVELHPGAWLRVIGEVMLYNGLVEVVPQRAIDVQSTDARPAGDEATPTPIGALSGGRLGETVTLEGQVMGVRSFSAGFKLILEDHTGQVEVLLWLPVFDELADRSGLDLGSQLRVTGEVEEYRQELQIIPLSGGDVTVLAPGTEVDSPTEIGALSATRIGSRVTIEGWIVSAERFSGGHRFQVSDGTGEVTALLWENLYRRMEDTAEVKIGARVTIIGVLAEYGGVIELVPQLPHHVRVQD